MQRLFLAGVGLFRYYFRPSSLPGVNGTFEKVKVAATPGDESRDISRPNKISNAIYQKKAIENAQGERRRKYSPPSPSIVWHFRSVFGVVFNIGMVIPQTLFLLSKTGTGLKIGIRQNDPRPDGM